ncbi:MAG TPA: hypothetical protein VIG40_08305 [Tissierellaceae bacterium]
MSLVLTLFLAVLAPLSAHAAWYEMIFNTNYAVTEYVSDEFDAKQDMQIATSFDNRYNSFATTYTYTVERKNPSTGNWSTIDTTTGTIKARELGYATHTTHTGNSVLLTYRVRITTNSPIRFDGKIRFFN